MAILTLRRLSEQILGLLEGGDLKAASSLDYDTIKTSCCQVINQLLKTEHFSVNLKMGETIPNGSVLGLYENIDVVSYNGKSKSTLPVKPLKLPKNMGVFAIYPKTSAIGGYDLDKEFIPLEMGVGGLIRSQPMINDLFGQIGYECYGNDIIYSKDLTSIYQYIKVAMRLVIMDISEYGDYDMLPLPPEFEWAVIKEVYQLYSTQPIPSKLVDSTVAEDKGVPLRQQKQS